MSTKRDPDPRQSHRPAKGASLHDSDCNCVRCRGFQPGNQVAVGNRGGPGRAPEHGIYSPLVLSARAREIEAWLWSIGSHLTTADAPDVQLLALVFARLERFDLMLGELDELIQHDGRLEQYLTRLEKRGRLSEDARRWIDQGRRLADDLGLSPHGRAALDERLQITVNVAEVNVVMGTLAQLTAEYVAPERRREFLEALAAANAELAEQRSVFQLPPPAETDS